MKSQNSIDSIANNYANKPMSNTKDYAHKSRPFQLSAMTTKLIMRETQTRKLDILKAKFLARKELLDYNYERMDEMRNERGVNENEMRGLEGRVMDLREENAEFRLEIGELISENKVKVGELRTMEKEIKLLEGNNRRLVNDFERVKEGRDKWKAKAKRTEANLEAAQEEFESSIRRNVELPLPCLNEELQEHLEASKDYNDNIKERIKELEQNEGKLKEQLVEEEIKQPSGLRRQILDLEAKQRISEIDMKFLRLENQYLKESIGVYMSKSSLEGEEEELLQALRLENAGLKFGVKASKTMIKDGAAPIDLFDMNPPYIVNNILLAKKNGEEVGEQGSEKGEDQDSYGDLTEFYDEDTMPVEEKILSDNTMHAVQPHAASTVEHDRMEEISTQVEEGGDFVSHGNKKLTMEPSATSLAHKDNSGFTKVQEGNAMKRFFSNVFQASKFSSFMSEERGIDMVLKKGEGMKRRLDFNDDDDDAKRKKLS